MPWYYLPGGAVALWLLGQLAVLGPALRAAAVPPVVATRGAWSTGNQRKCTLWAIVFRKIRKKEHFAQGELLHNFGAWWGLKMLGCRRFRMQDVQ
jgi:hypothetical protein